MSEQAPAPQDTPAVVGPEGTPDTAEQTQQEIDWQRRYVDLQPEYTRATQRTRELEQRQEYYELALTSDDPDTRRQAIEALGYAYEDSDESPNEPVYEDPYDSLRADMDAVRADLAQRDRAQQEAQENALIGALTQERLQALDGLATEDQDWVLAYAINALPAVREAGVPVPVPDIQGAYDVFIARETERQKAWAKTKRAPYVPSGGLTATEVPNLDTHQGRVDYAMQKLAEHEQAS